MLPIHSNSKGSKRRSNGKSSGITKVLKSVSASSWFLLTLMTSVNLFLLVYSTGGFKAGFGGLLGAKSEAGISSNAKFLHGQHSNRNSKHSHFSMDSFHQRKDLEPHKDLIRSNVAVATFASEAYLYHVKTLVGSVQYWQQDFQVNVYYKTLASNNLGPHLESLKSVRAISIAEAIEDILEIRNEGKGVCSSLLSGLGNKLDRIEQLAEKEFAVLQPIVTLHSFCTSEDSLGTLYIEPWMFFNGWVDIVVRSLQYDSYLVPCTDPAERRNACLKGIQGYGSLDMVESLLLPQLGCSVVDSCSFLDKIVPKTSENRGFGTTEGMGSWWANKSPEFVVQYNDKCLNSTNLMVASHQKIIMGDETDAEDERGEMSCLVGHTSQTYMCHLRYNRITAYNRYLSSSHHKRKKAERNGRSSVALGFVIHTPVSSLLSKAGEMNLLDGVLTSLSDELQGNTANYKIQVYLAFESSGADDVDAEAARQVQDQVKTSLGLSSVEVVSVGNTDSISTVSNLLFQLAMEDGHDYFMAFGDATRLEKWPSSADRSWLSELISIFSKTELQNFGVVAPYDGANAKGITSPLVHRTHFKIFGVLYPDHLTFYESQIWISLVYGYQHTYLMTEVVVNTDKQKAAPCKNDHLLRETVQSGKLKIARWALDLGGDAGDYMASFLSVQDL